MTKKKSKPIAKNDQSDLESRFRCIADVLLALSCTLCPGSEEMRNKWLGMVGQNGYEARLDTVTSEIWTMFDVTSAFAHAEPMAADIVAAVACYTSGNVKYDIIKLPPSSKSLTTEELLLKHSSNDLKMKSAHMLASLVTGAMRIIPIAAAYPLPTTDQVTQELSAALTAKLEQVVAEIHISTKKCPTIVRQVEQYSTEHVLPDLRRFVSQYYTKHNDTATVTPITSPFVGIDHALIAAAINKHHVQAHKALDADKSEPTAQVDAQLTNAEESAINDLRQNLSHMFTPNPSQFSSTITSSKVAEVARSIKEIGIPAKRNTEEAELPADNGPAKMSKPVEIQVPRRLPTIRPSTVYDAQPKFAGMSMSESMTLRVLNSLKVEVIDKEWDRQTTSGKDDMCGLYAVAKTLSAMLSEWDPNHRLGKADVMAEAMINHFRSTEFQLQWIGQIEAIFPKAVLTTDDERATLDGLESLSNLGIDVVAYCLRSFTRTQIDTSGDFGVAVLTFRMEKGKKVVVGYACDTTTDDRLVWIFNNQQEGHNADIEMKNHFQGFGPVIEN